MEINLGPLSFRAYNDSSFGDAVIGYTGKHGLETAVRAGIRSQHLTLAQGKDNPDDSFICPNSGKTFFGKTGLSNVSAKEVYAIEMGKLAEQAKLEAGRAAMATKVS